MLDAEPPTSPIASSEETAGIPEGLTLIFPQYKIVRVLGRGGMGTVYLARHARLNRLVALKLLSREHSSEFAARFEREARTMARLSHPAIVGFYDSGQTPDGRLFLVMEYVEGATLAELIAHPPEGFDPHAIALQVCDALAYSHGEGVLHRDIKPGNVLVDARGRVKVADFGLARLIGAEDSVVLTTAGKVMGTPGYMAPEQMRGEIVDQRTDIFALGALIYEMLCHERPSGMFDPPSTRIGCDPRWDAIVNRAMHADPAQRFASAVEMRAAIEAVGTTPAALEVVRSRKRGRVVAVLAVLAVLALGTWFMRSRDEIQPRRVASATPVPTPDPDAAWIAATRSDVPAVKAEESALTTVALREGEWTDLLSHIDPARDSIRGTWEKIENGLACAQPFPWALCSFPVQEPEGDYDLRFRVTRGEGSHLAMLFLFRKNGTGGYAPIDYIDASKPEFSDGQRGAGIESLGPPMFAPGGLMARRAEWLPRGRTTTVVLQVREAVVRLVVDGAEIYRWPADWSKLRQVGGTGGALFHSLPPQPFFGVGIYNCAAVFHTIEMRRVATGEPAPPATLSVSTEPPQPPIYPAPKQWIDATEALRTRLTSWGAAEVRGEWLHVTQDKTFNVANEQPFGDVALRVTYSGPLMLVLRQSPPLHYLLQIDDRGIAELVVWNSERSDRLGFSERKASMGATYDLREEHVATAVARGGQIALWVDGKLVLEQFNDTLTRGIMAVQFYGFRDKPADRQPRVKKIEYAPLDDLSNASSPASPGAVAMLAQPPYPEPKEWVDVTDSVRSRVLAEGRGEVNGEWLHVAKAGEVGLEDYRAFRDVALRATYKGRLFLVLRHADDRHYVASLDVQTASLWLWSADSKEIPSFTRQRVPLGRGYDPKQEHVATFVARGSNLAFWIDGKLVATQFDESIPAGSMAIQVFNPNEDVEPLWIRKVEYGVLDE